MPRRDDKNDPPRMGRPARSRGGEAAATVLVFRVSDTVVEKLRAAADGASIHVTARAVVERWAARQKAP